MRYIDIISPSPENFIFKKNSNKTILGGMISLIYFVSILLIFLTYGSLFSLMRHMKLPLLLAEKDFYLKIK